MPSARWCTDRQRLAFAWRTMTSEVVEAAEAALTPAMLAYPLPTVC